MTRIVTMKDTSPLVVRPQDLDGRPLSICRCGLSADWPYCDGSHTKTRSEMEGKVYRYRRVAKDEELEQEEVADADPKDADPRPE